MWDGRDGRKRLKVAGRNGKKMRGGKDSHMSRYRLEGSVGGERCVLEGGLKEGV